MHVSVYFSRLMKSETKNFIYFARNVIFLAPDFWSAILMPLNIISCHVVTLLVTLFYVS